MFAQVAAVIAVSRVMERQLLSLGCPRAKLIYNPCGADCNRFLGADPAGAPPHFVALGRMVEKKAPYLTLAAFARVLDENPLVRLRMIGTGDLLGVCRDLATGLSIDHAVTFLGPQRPEEVQEVMRNARAFVQHSITASDGDSEGTPVGVLEAGAAGLPVVSTRHAGILDVVIEGETGLLVDERDVTGMARQMAALAENPAFAAELGRNASRHIRRYYTLDQSINRLSQVLEAAALCRSMMPVRQAIEAEFPHEPSFEPFPAHRDRDPTS
jgi:glycosyltransferase involved in cell wall biosynthesis